MAVCNCVLFMGMASHAFGAVQDIIPDRKANIASIATAFGARATVWFCIVLYLSAALLVTMQGMAYLAVGLAGLAYVANILPYWAVNDDTSPQTNRAWKRFIWLNYLSGAVVTLVIISVCL
jgi:4-hydroxybenzoate polyprenyltransferase